VLQYRITDNTSLKSILNWVVIHSSKIVTWPIKYNHVRWVDTH